MRRSTKLAVLTLALLLFSIPAVGDGPQTGTIGGRVVDAQGEPLPGAAVTLTGPQGEKTVITGTDGRFLFGLLPAGDYALSARLEGLGSADLSAHLDTGARRTFDLTLGAATEETITVTAEAALVDKYTVGASAALDSDVAEDLTFKGRNYQSSVEALPGVVHDATSRFQGDIKFAVNGGQDTEVAGFVDGVDTSFARFNGSPRAFLPISALEEVRLDDAGFGAEYGRVVGGVVNAAVKSGTNRFHGMFLYIPQNQKWRAEYDAFPELQREDDIIDSFETNLGGPLVRDRAWFFAAYAEQSTNQLDQLADGTAEDVSFKNEVSVLKLNFQPTDRHYVTVLGVDSPVEKVHANVRTGDRFAPCGCDLEGEILTASWAFSVSSAAFLEVKAASQENGILRNAVRLRDIEPNASPDDPLGNRFSYEDRANRIAYNAIGQAAGLGFITIPRDQANAALSLFQSNHELKFGVDYQDIEMETFSDIGKRYFGFGYDENLPGGFAQPQFVNVYDPAAPVVTTTDVLSAYAQDRVTLGDKWTVYGGLRFDDQTQDNDIGIETASWTEVAPRAGAIYDVKADGRLLLKVNAGRYFQVHPQDLVSREFGTLPNGRNLFNQLGWNPATQRYDVFLRRVTPADPNEVQRVDPYYKDEVTAGVAWQFSDNWAFETTAMWWELDDLYLATDQFDENGLVFRDVSTWDGAFRDYRGIRFELRRRFSGNWTLSTNYTLSENEGNNFGRNDNVVLFDDDLFEALGGVEVGTGATDATIVNRAGRGFLDRTHNLNIVGLRQFRIGSHSVGVGGYFGYRSGERWGLRRATNVAHPTSGQIIRTSTYVQPRDAEQLDDTWTLNLTGTWTFPIRGRFNGRLGVELANVTDEQEVIGINRRNGRPLPGVAAYQIPREIRLQAGVTF